MVGALDAKEGNEIPQSESLDSGDHALMEEVLDFVKEHKTLTAIAGIGAAAGAVYLARAPLGRLFGRMGASICAAEEAAPLAASLGKTPLGREMAVAAEDVLAAGVKVESAASRRPLLNALDEAARAGKLNAPEPWVYHPENRVILRDLPKGGTAEIKSADGGLDAVATVHSTHSPDAKELTRLAFPDVAKPPLFDVNKHRFLRGK